MKQSQDVKSELQDKISKARKKETEKVLGTNYFSIQYHIDFYSNLSSFLITIVEKKESLLVMAEKQEKIEDSNQTVTLQVKEKEEINTAQIEGRCYFVSIALDILTFDYLTPKMIAYMKVWNTDFS